MLLDPMRIIRDHIGVSPLQGLCCRMEASGISPQSDSSSASSTEYKFVDTDRPAALLKGFSSIYDQKQFVDIILVCVDAEFPCHRNVLAVSSPFFMAMFTHDLQERHKSRIHIREMDPRTMQLVLDYIYNGEVVLTEDSVQQVLSAANMFQMISLRNGCADYMMKHVTVANCIGVYFFAQAHHCEQLAKRANEFLTKNFSVLCEEQEFLSLPCDQVIQIIRDDRLNVTQEEVVFEACLAWINIRLDDRRKYLVDIMRYVRFAIVSSYYFCDKIDNNLLLTENRAIRETLRAVKYYHMLRNRQNEIDLNFVPRGGMPYVRGIIIIANPYVDDGSRKFNSMEILMPTSGTIHHLCKLPTSLYMPGVAITGDNQIYLAGGAIRRLNYRGPFSAEGVSSNVYTYERQFGSWQVKAKMLQPRSQFCLAVVDGTILAVGGQNETTILDSVEVYDTRHNNWTQRAPLPQPLRCLTSVNYKGSLYVFGGESDQDISRSAYRYDMNENTWIELPPLHTPRVLASSIVHRNKIYVIGGNCQVSSKWKKELLPEHTVSTVEIFDPATGMWTFGPELPNALCGAGAVRYGDTIMVVGGEDDKSWMAGLFMLKHGDNGEDRWVEGQELPTVMSTFGCVVADIPKELFKDEI